VRRVLPLAMSENITAVEYAGEAFEERGGADQGERGFIAGGRFADVGGRWHGTCELEAATFEAAGQFQQLQVGRPADVLIGFAN
jgi:hypothetical protein